MFYRLWVQILSPDTGWTWHFFTLICWKNWIVCLKKTKNKRKRGRDGPFKKSILRPSYSIFFLSFKRFLCLIPLCFNAWPWSSLLDGVEQPDWPNSQTWMECSHLCAPWYVVNTTAYNLSWCCCSSQELHVVGNSPIPDLQKVLAYYARKLQL